ncbi:hypothetical protein M2271_007253 [Streptomyces sp. LBL]|uniref:hypothetical protein n=1 Tax=Streptomyces sp. LBL TaxID=2940562 RepID=UPI00247556E8|nr:hypothetical protein [Streptomyces sp. LBL]MDH6629417.1 hypothetical protein [Streptomyces sp. LBL]
MRAKLKLLAYAFLLLALAHPAVVPPLLGTLGVLVCIGVAVSGWAFANLSLTLTIAAGVTLAQVFPGALGRMRRWLARALVASVAAVAPSKA